MPVGLLDSQLRVLESPGSEELDVIELDLGSPIETLVQDAVDALQRTSKPKGRESSG
jgi:gluconate kinase